MRQTPARRFGQHGILALMDSLLNVYWVYGILVVAALYLLTPPLLVLTTFRMEADPALELIDPNELHPPPVVQQHFEAVGAELGRLGFEDVGTLLLPNPTPGTFCLLRVFANRPARVSAMASSMFGMANTKYHVNIQHLAYVEFTTRFAGGEVFNTLNSKESGSLPLAPKTMTVRVPWIDDVGRLYQIHDAIMSADPPVGARVLRLDSEYNGDVAAYIKSCMREEMKHASDANYLRLTADGTKYRPTLRGAYLMTWRQMPPIKQFVAHRDRRRVKRLLDALGSTGRM